MVREYKPNEAKFNALLTSAMEYSKTALPQVERKQEGTKKNIFFDRLEQMRAAKEARQPIFTVKDKYEPENVEAYAPPPQYPLHEVCKHPLDGEIKWTRNNYLEFTTYTLAGGQPGMKSSISKCAACTPEQEKIKHDRVMKARLDGESQLPQYARDYTFSNFPPEKDQFAKEMIEETVRNSILNIQRGENGTNLYIHGAPGEGKTSLAASAGKEYMLQGIGVYFTSVRKYLRALQAVAGNVASEEQLHAEELALNAPVLVFDDLGAEDGTAGKKVISDWAVGKIFDIFEERLSKGLVTIITSNNSPAGLRKKLSNATPTKDGGGAEVQDQAGRIYRRIGSYYTTVEMNAEG